MAFYIYENWQAGPRKAVIHRGSCGHCNEGKGRAGGYDPAHARWHGPFNDLAKARGIQKSMKVVKLKECRCVVSGSDYCLSPSKRNKRHGSLFQKEALCVPLPPKGSMVTRADCMKIGLYEFNRVCDIAPERAEDGSVLEFMPQSRYHNKDNLRLNNYGQGPFCKFKIPNNYNLGGVYAILVDRSVKYIGECQNLSSRYNSGYGNISPKNCFEDGQETNCRINNLVLQEAQEAKDMSLWFMATNDRKSVERELRAGQKLEWNII